MRVAVEQRRSPSRGRYRGWYERGRWVEDHMLTLLKRHQVQTLLAAGHDQIKVADLAGVSVRSVRRIAGEPAVEHVDDR